MILLTEQGLYMPKIEVIYATIKQQKLIKLVVDDSSTIQQCIELSGVLQQFPEIDLEETKVGIFSQVKPLDYMVSESDRIEIYRPLLADPKAVRRKKAEAAKSKQP